VYLVAKSKGSRPDAQAEITFAGFTELEWLSAVSLTEGQQTATGKIRSLFTDIRLRGSNGWAISRSSWALLSLVNDDCKERVSEAIRLYPAEFQQDVWQAASEYWSMIADGTLQSKHQAAVANWYLANPEANPED